MDHHIVIYKLRHANILNTKELDCNKNAKFTIVRAFLALKVILKDSNILIKTFL